MTKKIRMQVAALSPHRDDAAFSCGLILHSLLKAGCSVTIVNVCTVSRYAPYISTVNSDDTQQVTNLRRDEDVEFIRRLRHAAGADSSQIEVVDLMWQDVPVRWSIEDDRALAHIILRNEEIEKLESAFRELPTFDLVFVPMALGGHLDHRLVTQAAMQAFAASSRVFYEDLPYACRMPDSERISNAVASDTPISDAWLPAQTAPVGLKRDFALSYPSQIAQNVAEEMEEYAARHGGRERFLAGAEAAHRLTTALQAQNCIETA